MPSCHLQLVFPYSGSPQMRQKSPDTPIKSSSTTLMHISLMLILVSFFVVLVSRANFDETKYLEALSSIKQTLGLLPGGRSAIGTEDGHLLDTPGFEQSDTQVIPNLELAKVRALLAPAILNRDASIIHTLNKRIVSLSGGLMFRKDSAEIKPEAAETLKAFALAVAKSSTPITIEGHTGNRPPQTAGIGDNWDISSRRAVAVLDFLVREGGLDQSRLSAFGYAHTKPRHFNMSPTGRARNNRVDLVLDTSRVSAKELENLKEKPSSYIFKGFDFSLEEYVGPQP